MNRRKRRIESSSEEEEDPVQIGRSNCERRNVLSVRDGLIHQNQRGVVQHPFTASNTSLGDCFPHRHASHIPFQRTSLRWTNNADNNLALQNNEEVTETTPEERVRARNRENQRRRRGRLSAEQALEIRERNTQSHQIYRQNLTEEQREVIRRQDATAHQTNRQNMPAELRELIRRQNSTAHQIYRQNMPAELRELIRRQNSTAHQIYRQNMPAELRELIRRQDATAHQANRRNMPSEQRELVRSRDAAAHQISRQNLTAEGRAAIRRADADSHRIARNNFSEIQRVLAQQQNASAHRIARDNQSPQQRQQINSARRTARNNRNSNLHAGLNREELPPPHFIGNMDDECSHCAALYFPNEQPRASDGTYNPCCRNGSVTLDLFTNYPQMLKDLFTGDHPKSKNFLDNIRKFNTSLSIASMNCNLAEIPGRGPYVFKIHGSICYQTGPAMPPSGRRPTYGQLFFVDDTVAADHRISHQANVDCDQALLRFLSHFMRNEHEYATGFKMLYEIYKEEEEKSMRTNQPMANIKLVYKTQNTPDPRRYNPPRMAEVALVYASDDGEVPTPREFTIQLRGGGLRTIPLIHRMLDPCTYPLFFIKGDFGWDLDRLRVITKDDGTVVNKKMTQKDYYCYYLSNRASFSPILKSRKLLQQYTVGSWCNTEQNRLNFIRNNQSKLRSEFYNEVREFLADNDGGKCGARVLLPASFTSSPRYMAACYMDAMAITSQYGKPDLFLTFTCNPGWKEITANLGEGQTATDRPDLLARVFRLKFRELKKDIIERHVFGRVIAYIFTVEWQKRGLPHVHMLITLAPEDKPQTPDDVDLMICAEIPDVDGNMNELGLLELVGKHMLHRDCGPGSPCWNNGACTKRFPKAYQDATDMDVDGYPVYRRRNLGTKIRIGAASSGNAKFYDNRSVVPFSPYLLSKFHAHINLEICSEIHAVKYLYKYVYKGSDKAALRLRKERRDANGGVIDEVEEHIDGRYICPPEAYHRLFAYELHGKSHAVIDLAVHEPNKHVIVFEDGQEQAALDRNKKTTLLAFFDLNKKAMDLEGEGRLDELGPVDPRTLFYYEIPRHFTFDKKNSVWNVKRQANNNIGRVHSVAPKFQERYCIRMLLHHTMGAISYEDLRSVNGHVFPTAYEAAKERGLIQTADHFDSAMNDANFFRMPHALRSVFATLLAFDGTANAQEMWDKWKDNMADDYLHRGRTAVDAEALAYYDVLEMCRPLGIHIATYIRPPLPARPPDRADDIPDYENIGREMYTKLNEKQKEAVDAILSGANKLVFLDGPGGTGKTFCYECVYNILKGNNKNVVTCAWTGIAANLLPGGRTIASLFRLNIAKNCESSSLTSTSREGRAMKEVDVIIIDECSMISDKAFDTIDTTLRDIMNIDQPFGGKVVLIGGDFRQVLPIPNKLLPLDPYYCSLMVSKVFPHFSKYKLTANMRAAGEAQEFKQFLLDIGEDRIPKDEEGKIEIPSDLICHGDLIEDIFQGVYDNPDHLNSRAILCSTNKHVDEMNKKILDKINAPSRIFLSADSVEKQNDDDQLLFTDEFLNSLNPTDLPPHKLELKNGAIVMLIRNINVREGHCNGTRLQVEEFYRMNALKCRFINGANKGKSVIIPRIDLQTTKMKVAVDYGHLYSEPVTESWELDADFWSDSNEWLDAECSIDPKYAFTDIRKVEKCGYEELSLCQLLENRLTQAVATEVLCGHNRNFGLVVLHEDDGSRITAYYHRC